MRTGGASVRPDKDAGSAGVTKMVGSLAGITKFLIFNFQFSMMFSLESHSFPWVIRGSIGLRLSRSGQSVVETLNSYGLAIPRRADSPRRLRE